MATYYWVGGNGTWDGSSKANWSNVSGGSSGFGPPTSVDTVIFDSSSGTGTCTTAAGSACSLATLNSATLGLTLGANHTMSSTFTLTAGTLSLGTYTLTCNVFSSSNTNTRTIAFGSGNITLTANATTIWNTGIATGFSYTGTPTVNCNYSGSTGTRTITNCTSGVKATTQSISFNITAGSDIVTVGTSYCFDLNFTGFSGSWTNTAATLAGSLVVSSGMTVNTSTAILYFDAIASSGTQKITSNGKTLDFPVYIGTGATNPTVQLQDNVTLGSTRTFLFFGGTLNLNNKTLSTGIFSSSNSNTRSIAFGTGNISLTGNAATVWNAGNVAGFTYTGTPTINLTYSGSTGTRTINAGSASGSESNALNFNISAGSDIVIFGSNNNVKNVNFTGFTGSFTNTALAIYGDVTYSSGMTVSAGSSVVTFGSSTTQQITTNGKTLDFPIAFVLNGVASFQDSLTQGSTKAFTFNKGTIQLKAGVTSTVGVFATTGTTQKYLQSTSSGSQATLSQTSGTVTVSYLSIKDIAATGGATWNAYVDFNNVDQGGNTGWDFSYSPAIDNEFPVALRSFTQPKRF